MGLGDESQAVDAVAISDTGDDCLQIKMTNKMRTVGWSVGWQNNKS